MSYQTCTERGTLSGKVTHSPKSGHNGLRYTAHGYRLNALFFANDPSRNPRPLFVEVVHESADARGRQF